MGQWHWMPSQKDFTSHKAEIPRLILFMLGSFILGSVIRCFRGLVHGTYIEEIGPVPVYMLIFVLICN